MSTLERRFRLGALTPAQANALVQDAAERLGVSIACQGEWCFYVESEAPLTESEWAVLDDLLAETFDPEGYGQNSFLGECPTRREIGPRLHFASPFSSTAVDICHDCNIPGVTRLERSLSIGFDVALADEQADSLVEPLFDRMTQMIYREPLTTLAVTVNPEPVEHIDLMSDNWEDHLRAYDKRYGCGWDAEDRAAIGRQFREREKRNATDVELFQWAQANSEHSRHHCFKGVQTIDGVELPQSLMEMVQEPFRLNPGNSVVAFSDDASAIQGSMVRVLQASNPSGPGPLVQEDVVLHPTGKAETHNHPTVISPYPGAETGPSGRQRDDGSVGRGGKPGMGSAGFMTGQPHIPCYPLPGEDVGWVQPAHMAPPLRILREASNGAFDYGNCFGEPVTQGTARSTGITMADGRRFEWLKPIMYTGGAGHLRQEHLLKRKPQVGMLVIQIGGPAYRIGLGGGAASSMIGGSNDEKLDWGSVQRGAAQMQQRFFRLITACVEMGEKNPIVTIHDLGAGGLSNAVPEILDPVGGLIRVKDIPSGDPSLSIRELWGNESQEREVLIIAPESLRLLKEIAARESVPLAVIGEVTGSGRIQLEAPNGELVVDLPLADILGSLPRKRYSDERQPSPGAPLQLPPGLTVREALDGVLRSVAVGSKDHLANKVDAGVGGRIVQQQRVGPLHLPLADCAILADAHANESGVVHALGEQPLAGMLSPGAAARLALAEAFLNMSGASISRIEDVRASANWMLAAKFRGNRAWLWDAMQALRDACIQLGMAIDGGKDSLSMAVITRSPNGESVMVESPPTLILKAYATMSDVNLRVTPDLKRAGNSLVRITCSPGKYRLGGSILAEVHGQLGDVPPDVDDVRLLGAIFRTLQEMVRDELIVSLHDVSDGGLITTLLEMAFAGHLGMAVSLPDTVDTLSLLFAQEPGVVVECPDAELVLGFCGARGIPAECIGTVTQEPRIVVRHGGQTVLDEKNDDLRAIWTETSYQLERLQSNPACADSERKERLVGRPVQYTLTFDPKPALAAHMNKRNKPRVAVLRAPGSNGDREMGEAFRRAGFEPWDITMHDLLTGKIGLDRFRGLVAVGGFSYADVLGSAVGWAGVIRNNPQVRDELERFRARRDTFQLGVCNGCQLFALLGWVPGLDLPRRKQPRFIHNQSGRFESRFSSLRIKPNPSIMLRGMWGSVLGCWVAHGEGRLFVPEAETVEYIAQHDLVAMCYATPEGEDATAYPFNPNGSMLSAAALCSPDGRTLAMMPHFERGVINWQSMPWKPELWKRFSVGPWQRVANNARFWCDEIEG